MANDITLSLINFYFFVSIISFQCLPFALLISSADILEGCTEHVPQVNVFMDTNLLKQTKVFSNLSNERPCDNPGYPCPEPDYCKQQLRNVPVSNMVPCCVKLQRGSSVCQCVATIPNSKPPNQCPSSNLILVSNQLFNMTGISRFFDVEYPICSSLFNSWNIYKGVGPVLEASAKPLVKTKIGVQGFTAGNVEKYYFNWYMEFLLTCKTKKSFVSDDLKLCTREQLCNSILPTADILLDASDTDLTNPVFHPLNGQSNCATIAPKTDNQCPATTTSKCDKSKPCCYSNKCMFPFNPANDTCPCPPPHGDLFLFNEAVLACNNFKSSSSRIGLFNKSNPPAPQEFVWDVNNDAEKTSTLLVARGTVKFPVRNCDASLYWYGEVRFRPEAFEGCLAEIFASNPHHFESGKTNFQNKILKSL